MPDDAKKLPWEPLSLEALEGLYQNCLRQPEAVVTHMVGTFLATVMKAQHEAGVYRDSLKRIARMGAVCPDYGTCQHAACNDSCGACLLAINTLNEIDGVTDAKPNRDECRQVLQGTFIACGEGGQYCSELCQLRAENQKLRDQLIVSNEASLTFLVGLQAHIAEWRKARHG